MWSQNKIQRLRNDTYYDVLGIAKSFLWDDVVEISPNVFLGNFTHCFFLNTLKSNKITGIVNITNSIPNYWSNEIDYFNIKIEDVNESSIINGLEDCYNFIQKHINNDGRVIIHCVFGRSRSVAMCIFYLMKQENITFMEAYERLEKLKPIININTSFANEIKSYFKV